MDELRKIDKEFARFYAKKKKTSDVINKKTGEKEEFKKEVIAEYIESLEKKEKPVPISWGKVSQCFRISPHIIKKVFLHDNHRISWELDALSKLQSYPGFPKILLSYPEKRTFYMNDVGRALKEIKSKKLLPEDLWKQVDGIITALKESEIFHRDLAMEHFRIKDGRLSVIDFEKCYLTKVQYEQNQKANSSTWQKLQYHDMDQIRIMIEAFYNKLAN